MTHKLNSTYATLALKAAKELKRNLDAMPRADREQFKALRRQLNTGIKALEVM